MLTLCIGGDKIDWNIPGSVNTVCELLGVGKSSVYEYRKVKELKFKPHGRKRRRTALDQMPWWDHASAVMETFWEENCDEVPDADNPAEKHDFTVKENHRFDPLPGNPDVTKRVCVGTWSFPILLHYITSWRYMFHVANVCTGTSCRKHAKWNARGCDTAMHRLFLSHHGEEWGDLITKKTLIESKPWWVVTPKNE